ncbi:MAG: site-specific DNA-methyltransferase [Syntrophomonadaceae bacterium]|nr:site-specific DNA-methyltransferase [Syntrophomonadaceae bacterium]
MLLSNEERLKNLLRELFQLDKSDLDFGIYRVMNILNREMEEFINHTLEQKLNAVKNKLAVGNQAEVKAEMESLQEELVSSYGKDFESEAQARLNDQRKMYDILREKFPRCQLLRQQLAALRVSDEVVADIYNDLYRFFERYYEDGDFIARPRAGSSSYMMPYDGEEVSLYWATQDQYYIKTGENFRNYSFHNGRSGSERVSVEFILQDALTSLNNNQNSKGRLFIPTEDYFDWCADENRLCLYFYYKLPSEEEKERWGSKQSLKTDNKGINERLLLDLEEKIKTVGSPLLLSFWEQHSKIQNGEAVQDFKYHLQRYVNVNSFDYFIHKNLKGFLCRELDYYLKNEIVRLDFLNPHWQAEQAQKAMERVLVRATAVKELALFVIDFMAMFEEFQKMLFEKKKMVVQSDYCLTLDLLDPKVHKAVLAAILSDPGKRQLKAWQELGFIEDLDINAGYIKEHDKLVMDTQYLTTELKDRLLASFANLDETCGGLIIESENWQALNLLQEKYKGQVKCIYIDPPYNTNASEIAYKNGYKDSSWLSLIDDRISLANVLVSFGGIECITIDDVEFSKLMLLMDRKFGIDNIKGISVIRNNPSGRSTASGFSIAHEYAVFASKDDKAKIGRLDRGEKQKARYSEKDEKGYFEWVNFRKHGGTRQESAKMFFPIFLNETSLRIPKMEWNDDNNEWKLLEYPRDNETIIYPIDENGSERRWKWGIERTIEEIDEFSIRPDRQNKMGVYIKSRINDEGMLPLTWWDKKEYSATSYGTNLLKNLFGTLQSFSYPKSIFAVEDSLKVCNLGDDDIVLDYFAGSGTTGHAVINLNREDKGHRKYILVEMGEYFETVLKQRLQKVMYSANWRNGKPREMDGVSHMFQYLRLEQYEDSLNNMEFEPDLLEKAQIELPLEQKLLYLLQRSAQNSDCILNLDKFEHPFDYTLEITRYNERRPEKVDLVGTFNFLLGLTVRQILVKTHQKRFYKIVLGYRGAAAYAVIWRNFDSGLDLDGERKWIQKQDWYQPQQQLYANADNLFGAQMIEAEFFRRMFVNVTGDYYAE